MNWFPTSLSLLLLLHASPCLSQEVPPPDPCEGMLGYGPQTAWPGIVLDVPTGDTLQIQLKNIGSRRVKLAGIRAPRDKEALAAVSRFHLERMAKGLRVFVVLDPPWKTWPAEVTAIVEDFAEAQLAAGLARTHPGETELMGPFGACRAARAEELARSGRLGIWGEK